MCFIPLVVIFVYPDPTLASAKYNEIEGKWNVALTLRELNVTNKCKQGSAALDLDAFAVTVTLDTGNTDMKLLRDVLASFGDGEVICTFRVVNGKCAAVSTGVHVCACAVSKPPKYDLVIGDTLRGGHLRAEKRALRSLRLVVRTTRDRLPNITKVVDLSNVSLSPTPEFSLKVDGAPVSLDQCALKYWAGSMHTFKFCTQGLHLPKIQVRLYREKRVTRQRTCAFMDVYVRRHHALVKMAYTDACGRSGTYNCTVTGYGQESGTLDRSLQRLRGLEMPEAEKRVVEEEDHTIFIVLTVTGVCLVVMAVLRDSNKRRNTL